MTTHQDTGTEHPFVLVGSKGLAYVGLHKDEASCWMVALGWPDADEIAHRKAQGFAVYQATLTWQKQAALASRDEAAQQPQTPFDTCPTCEALARTVMMDQTGAA